MPANCKLFAYTAAHARFSSVSRFKRSLLPFALGAFCWLLAGAASAAQLKVLTSFLPVYCFAANVAGDYAQVENFLPPGTGPHDYQFSPKDVRKLSQADLILVNGLGLESWLDKALDASGSRKKGNVVELAAGLGSKELIRYEHGISLGGKEDHDHDNIYNPHIWLDPQLAIHAVKNIQAALAKADPANAPHYADNAKAYIAKLEKLDADIRAELQPVKHQAFVTFHSAFPYFVKRYDLKLAGVVEAMPDVQPSPRYLKRLMDIIRDKDVKALFAEPQFSSKMAARIAADAKINLGTLNTLETGEVKPFTYEEAMRENARTLLRLLK